MLERCEISDYGAHLERNVFQIYLKNTGWAKSR